MSHVQAHREEISDNRTVRFWADAKLIKGIWKLTITSDYLSTITEDYHSSEEVFEAIADFNVCWLNKVNKVRNTQ